MKNCPYCGTENPDDAQTCSNCTADLVADPAATSKSKGQEKGESPAPDTSEMETVISQRPDELDADPLAETAQRAEITAVSQPGRQGDEESTPSGDTEDETDSPPEPEAGPAEQEPAVAPTDATVVSGMKAPEIPAAEAEVETMAAAEPEPPLSASEMPAEAETPEVDPLAETKLGAVPAGEAKPEPSAFERAEAILADKPLADPVSAELADQAGEMAEPDAFERAAALLERDPARAGAEAAASSFGEPEAFIQPAKNRSLALGLEGLGLIGFLGFGWIYAGSMTTGVALLIGFGLFNLLFLAADIGLTFLGFPFLFCCHLVVNLGAIGGSMYFLNERTRENPEFLA